MADDTYGPGDYDVEIGAISQALQEASGSQKRALESQMQSAQAARENALKIAQLQAETNRYGVDAQRETEMAKLKENARQFDADHGLEIARAYTQYSATPDLMWARNDLVSALGRVGQGLNPAPIASQPQPHAKTWADFNALTQYNGQSANTFTAGGSGNGSSGSGGGGSAQPAVAAGGEPKDARLTATTAIMKALPPSESPGADGQDWAALNAIRQMYEAGKPGIAKLTASQQKTALAGMARLGYDPNRVQEDWMRGLPGQKSPLLSA